MQIDLVVTLQFEAVVRAGREQQQREKIQMRRDNGEKVSPDEEAELMADAWRSMQQGAVDDGYGRKGKVTPYGLRAAMAKLDLGMQLEDAVDLIGVAVKEGNRTTEGDMSREDGGMALNQQQFRTMLRQTQLPNLQGAEDAGYKMGLH